MEPSGDERFLRASARLLVLPYTTLASTHDVMAFSCSRRRRRPGKIPATQPGAERKKGMQLWVPLRGSDRGIWKDKPTNQAWFT